MAPATESGEANGKQPDVVPATVSFPSAQGLADEDFLLGDDMATAEDDVAAARLSQAVMPIAVLPFAAELPGYAVDDSLMTEWLPELRRLKWGYRGTRVNPEPPSLVAKVCQERGRGEIWLGPLPTARRMSTICETKHSIQIYCFAADIESRTVDNSPDQRGMRIPGALALRCEMSNPNNRADDVEAIMDCVINSVRQGYNAYVHCISGLSRGPVAAAIFSAKLMGISMEDAKWWIDQARNVKDERDRNRRGNREDMDGPWISRVLRIKTAKALTPTCFVCHVYQGQSTVHAATIIHNAVAPLCLSTEGARADMICPLADIQTFSEMEQAASQFVGVFCAECEPLMRASLRVRAS